MLKIFGISACIFLLAFLPLLLRSHFCFAPMSDTMSVVGSSSCKQPGDVGFRAPWLHAVLREINGHDTFGILEDTLGNLEAHEYILLIAANHTKFPELVKKVELPGLGVACSDCVAVLLRSQYLLMLDRDVRILVFKRLWLGRAQISPELIGRHGNRTG